MMTVDDLIKRREALEKEREELIQAATRELGIIDGKLAFLQEMVAAIDAPETEAKAKKASTAKKAGISE